MTTQRNKELEEFFSNWICRAVDVGDGNIRLTRKIPFSVVPFSGSIPSGDGPIDATVTFDIQTILDLSKEEGHDLDGEDYICGM